MKQVSEETRRRMSESAKRRSQTTEFLERVRGQWRPFCTREELERHYIVQQMTQEEIAAEYGVTLKRVQTSMRRYGIQPRRPVKRNQRGPANATWKADGATYAALHYRVIALKGRPRLCEACGTTDPSHRYEWANQTGAYDDPSDYKRMCPSCHKKLDAARRRETGERTMPRRGGDAQCPLTD